MNTDYPSDWDQRRKKVYQRDNYTCQNCGAQGGPHGNAELHAHHIVPKSKGGTHKISNLKTICNKCHNAIHNDAPAPTHPAINNTNKKNTSISDITKSYNTDYFSEEINGVVERANIINKINNKLGKLEGLNERLEKLLELSIFSYGKTEMLNDERDAFDEGYDLLSEIDDLCSDLDDYSNSISNDRELKLHKQYQEAIDLLTDLYRDNIKQWEKAVKKGRPQLLLLEKQQTLNENMHDAGELYVEGLESYYSYLQEKIREDEKLTTKQKLQEVFVAIGYFTGLIILGILMMENSGLLAVFLIYGILGSVVGLGLLNKIEG